MVGSNLHKQNFEVDRGIRERRLGQSAQLIWFTGLSGSGKSTLANLLEQRLLDLGFTTYLLDGDNVRHGLNKDLGFSSQDRSENIRRIAETSNLFLDAGIITIASFISPLASQRELVKTIIGEDRYIEIHVSTSLEECERRDVKGLYAKARSGDIPEFTGISSPYEIPLKPDLVIDTEGMDLGDSLAPVLDLVLEKIKR